MTVTIVLTTKGRHLHTLRWLWHHNRTNLPFEVILADGEVIEPIARLVEDPRAFPNLKLRYFKYRDESRSDYFAKLADVMTKVETPYVMMSDNDDFIMPSQLMRLAHFLDTAPGHVAAGGPPCNFSLWGGSEHDRLWQLAGHAYTFSTDKAIAYDQDDALLRMKAYFSNRCALYYHLLRTDAARDIHQGAAGLGLYKFPMWEHYLYLSLLSLGKVAMIPGIGYLRQLGVSQCHVTNMIPISQEIDEGDDRKVISAVANRLSRAMPTVGEDEALACVRDKFATVAATSNPGTPPVDRAWKRWLKSLAAARAYRRRQSLANIAADLLQAGANEEDLRLLDAEITEVRTTLQSSELRAFVTKAASEILE